MNHRTNETSSDDLNYLTLFSNLREDVTKSSTEKYSVRQTLRAVKVLPVVFM
jgi:hypothetical protein